jgi:putative two-component system response regulator
LYWCLTGSTPYPPQKTVAQQIARRLREPPPSVRIRRPETPPELDLVVMKMMALRPDERYQTPQAAMRALLPFLRSNRAETATGRSAVADTVWPLTNAEPAQSPAHRILIVDDEAIICGYIRAILQDDQTACDVAASGEEALVALEKYPYDLVLLDVILPGITGFEVLEQIRDKPACKHVRTVMMSGAVSPEDLANMQNLGADDFIMKPFGAFQLRARVQRGLRHSAALKRVEVLAQHTAALTHDLERQVEGRQLDQRQFRQALVQGLVALIRQRAAQSAGHLLRIQHDCRALAEAAAQLPGFAARIDRAFIQSLEYFAPLYDLGLVALPDHLLHDSGVLELEERIVFQTHPVLGSDILEKVSDAMGPAGDFLATAREIVRSHHEQHNGKGYPDQLSGEEIPLSARIMAIADSYDALRSRRQFQPGLPHSAACEVILHGSPGKFHPELLTAFQSCAAKFDEIFQQISE